MEARRVQTITNGELPRRFLLHVLPDGCVRMRYFGFLVNRWKKQDLSRFREILGLSRELPKPGKKTTRQLMLQLTDIDVNRCLLCKKGTMKVVGKIPKFSGGFFNASFSKPKKKDTA